MEKWKKNGKMEKNGKIMEKWKNDGRMMEK